MNLDPVIERHRKPLLRIVATLFAMIGLVEGGTVERLSWPLYRAVLRVLRPAEAAVRRLIMVAAQGLVVKPSPARKSKPGHKLSGKSKGKRKGRVSFPLFDPRQRFDRPFRFPTPVPRSEPRIRFLDIDTGFDPTWRPWRGAAPVAPPPAPVKDRTTVNAEPLCRRLAAIKGALEDLQKQARRYAKWRDRRVEERKPKLDSPLRPGPPPGHRKKPIHPVDEILSECHWLAWSLPKPDTS